MNPQDNSAGTPQSQVVDRLRTAVNVLVTVSNNPSVDQLAAAIGFTLALNKLGKHATAVFSGQIPSTMEFLKPEATIEKNTDSLRDFIVSLDKSKADKLRYKVEENVVKIFITPYRTSLSEKDLMFSQGDFNVDAVVALGVSEREQLDQAIIAHGRILHDATVITVSAGSTNSTLGAINWQDSTASSLCELMVTIGDSLQPGLLDNQIATAYLTGIVSQTERFRNDKTTPKIMTMAAQLMAAGANQQLIATELDHATEVPLKQDTPEEIPPSQSPDGSLTIEHGDNLPIPTTHLDAPNPSNQQIAIDEHGNMGTAEDNHSTERHMLEPLPTVPNEQMTGAELFAGGPHPFTANMSEDGEDEPSTDPLTVTSEPDGKPIMEHDKKASEPANVLPPVDSSFVQPTINPVPPLTNVDTVPPAFDNNTLRDIEKTFESKHIAQDPHSTLNEIEEVVESPHLNAQQIPQPEETLDSARDAVQDAIQSAPYDQDHPEPLQALNATDVNLPVGAQTHLSNDPVLAGLGLTNNVQNTMSAPVLPQVPENNQSNPVNLGQQLPQDGQTPPPLPPPLIPIQ